VTAPVIVFVLALGIALGIWLEHGVTKIERRYGRYGEPSSVGRVLARVVRRSAR
jgi:hypothetical protein